ncbi:MAG: DUF4878 domain-containing protein [Alistipes sp.]|jgi:hypothetical protein|nr:DUF4878 domain-containing protein [Alistipes sp.]
MKKLIYFVLAIAAAGVVASCGGGASTPGAAAKTYMEAMAAGNYDKFMDGIYMDPEDVADEDPETIERQKTMLKAMLEEKGAQSIEENGKIEKIEVLSEEIAEDGQTADVTLLLTYDTGETEEETVDMHLDGNSWKMEMSK